MPTAMTDCERRATDLICIAKALVFAYGSRRPDPAAEPPGCAAGATEAGGAEAGERLRRVAALTAYFAEWSAAGRLH